MLDFTALLNIYKEQDSGLIHEWYEDVPIAPRAGITKALLVTTAWSPEAFLLCRNTDATLSKTTVSNISSGCGSRYRVSLLTLALQKN